MDIEFIFQHFWLVMIVFACINVVHLRLRVNKDIASFPDKKNGYDTFFLLWLIYTIIPIIILMLGDISGSVHFLFEYLNPRSKNPFVMALYIFIISSWILIGWAIYFNGGAEFIEKHPAIMRKGRFSNKKNLSAKQIKLRFPLLLLFGLLIIILFYYNDMPYNEIFD